MITAAQDVTTVRLERAFDRMDADKDGYLDRSDHQKLADRYIQGHHLSQDDRRTRALRCFVQTCFLELLHHAGVDGDRITKEQFVTANRLALIDTSRLNMTEGGGHAIFDAIDALLLRPHLTHPHREALARL